MSRWALLAMLCLPLVGSAGPASSASVPLTGPLLTARVVHGFSVSDAHARVQQMLDYWHQRFGVASRWDGQQVWVQGTIWGVDFRARFEVSDGVVSAEATDPGPLWRRAAIDYTIKKLRKYLSPTYAEP